MLLRPATQQDLEHVAAQNVSGSFKEYPQDYNYIVALEHEGQAVACGGLKLLNPTTAWCWVTMAPAAVSNPYTLYRELYHWLENVVQERGIIRLMAAVDPDFQEAVRLVEHLGFEVESHMPRFDGEQTAVMYVRFKE